MLINKYLLSFRNKVAELTSWADSCAALDGACLTKEEQKFIKDSMHVVLDYLDEKIFEYYKTKKK